MSSSEQAPTRPKGIALVILTVLDAVGVDIPKGLRDALGEELPALHLTFGLAI